MQGPTRDDIAGALSISGAVGEDAGVVALLDDHKGDAGRVPLLQLHPPFTVRTLLDS